MGASIADIIRNRTSTLDSLKAVDQKSDSTRKALEAIQIKESKVDSLKNEIEKNKVALAEMTTLEKVETVPIVKGGKWVAEKATKLIGQGIFDYHANIINLVGAPTNLLASWAGYNPGISGERYMKNIFSDAFNEAGELIGMDLNIGPWFDEETAGALPLPWGRVSAPEGGEFTYERETKQKQAELEEAIKKIEEE